MPSTPCWEVGSIPPRNPFLILLGGVPSSGSHCREAKGRQPLWAAKHHSSQPQRAARPLRPRGTLCRTLSPSPAETVPIELRLHPAPGAPLCPLPL